ncbi:MAG TPA: autotransporter-associated beta strand repeat-containing protein, partial [Tepidisphaeraceae bacterium]
MCLQRQVVQIADGGLSCRGSKRVRAALAAAVGGMLLCPAFGTQPARANTADNVVSGNTDLTSSGSYSAGSPGAGSDMTFSGSYSSTTFSDANGFNLNIGTLDDLDATQSLTIQNGTASTTGALTLNGGGNSVAPSTLDLLYVASGGTMNIVNGSGTITVSLAASGNLDIAGTATISSVLGMGSNQITKTGTGNLTLGAANSGTGGFVISQGTVTVNGGSNSGNNALGSANNLVTLGTGADAVTLAFTSAESGIAQNFVIGGTGADSITNSSSNTSGVVFSASNTVMLENNLTVAATNASGLIGFRGTLSQLGGNFGITIGSTNAGTIDLRGANTFTGGVAIDAGTMSFNLGSTGSAGAVTNGPAGTGTITLGAAGSTAAATLAD